MIFTAKFRRVQSVNISQNCLELPIIVVDLFFEIKNDSVRHFKVFYLCIVSRYLK